MLPSTTRNRSNERLSLPPDEVHIWRVYTDRPADAMVWSRLSEDERCRARRLLAPSFQRRWIWSHAALRDVLSRYVGSRQTLSFRRGLFGKPCLDGFTDPHFNLSHSGGWALIALASGCEVGVDVESVRHSDDLKQIERRAFSSAEQAALSRLAGDEYVEAFYRCWTRKEASVKAWGLGLSADLPAFDVSVERGSSSLFRDGTTWSLTDVPLDDQHACAVVVAGGARSYRVLDWSGN